MADKKISTHKSMPKMATDGGVQNAHKAMAQGKDAVAAQKEVAGK